MTESTDTADLTAITADIVAAYIGNNTVKGDELANLIGSTYAALAGLSTPAPGPAAEKPQGAVSVRKSLAKPDAILSMIDGKPYKTLRRHVSRHGYTPESYREAFGLPGDYPMVAPAYSTMRGELARKIGLGRKHKAEVPPERSVETTPELVVEEAAAAAPKGRNPRKANAQPVPKPQPEPVAEAAPAPARRGSKKLGISGTEALAKVRGKAEPTDR